MRDIPVLGVVWQGGEEVEVDRFDVAAMRLVQHCLKSPEALAVSFECEELASTMKLAFIRSMRQRWRPVRTFPLFCIIAQRWDVLFPGAAVASITTASSRAGGARTCAGKQDALSWRMILPDRYSGSSVKRTLG